MLRYVILVSQNLFKIRILYRLSNVVLQLTSHLRFLSVKDTKVFNLIYGVQVSYYMRCFTELFHLRQLIWASCKNKSSNLNVHGDHQERYQKRHLLFWRKYLKLILKSVLHHLKSLQIHGCNFLRNKLKR